MADTIIQKHSLTSEAVPAIEQILPGEIAINAADGRVFIQTTDAVVVNLFDFSIADGGEIT